MIITQTPLRISLLGGGTDYPSWLQSPAGRKHGGFVVGLAIDKYVYVTVNQRPNYGDHRVHLAYSDIEHANSYLDVKHRVIKAAMAMTGVYSDVEIHTMADMPSRSGMGSSSAFAVGLLYALTEHLCASYDVGMLPELQIHHQAAFLEQSMLGDHVGFQDQTLATFGGLRTAEFRYDADSPNNTKISTVWLGDTFAMRQHLLNHLLLVWTGCSREASKMASSYSPTLGDKVLIQEKMLKLAQDGADAIVKFDMERLGKNIDTAWQLKRSLSSCVSTQLIDDIYNAGKVAGAFGGKLLGAGGGGCLLFVAPPERHTVIKKSLCDFTFIPISLDHYGTSLCN